MGGLKPGRSSLGCGSGEMINAPKDNLPVSRPESDYDFILHKSEDEVPPMLWAKSVKVVYEVRGILDVVKRRVA